MNKGFSSLGAFLKVINDTNGDDNALAFTESESDDHDCGSGKESEEPARKKKKKKKKKNKRKKKTGDAVVLSKDNSVILNK